MGTCEVGSKTHFLFSDITATNHPFHGIAPVLPGDTSAHHYYARYRSPLLGRCAWCCDAYGRFGFQARSGESYIAPWCLHHGWLLCAHRRDCPVLLTSRPYLTSSVPIPDAAAWRDTNPQYAEWRCHADEVSAASILRSSGGGPACGLVRSYSTQTKRCCALAACATHSLRSTSQAFLSMQRSSPVRRQKYRLHEPTDVATRSRSLHRHTAPCVLAIISTPVEAANPPRSSPDAARYQGVRTAGRVGFAFPSRAPPECSLLLRSPSVLFWSIAGRREVGGSACSRTAHLALDLGAASTAMVRIRFTAGRRQARCPGGAHIRENIAVIVRRARYRIGR